MATRDELLGAVASGYRSATRVEKGRILTEFTEISGYHRKHAERLLRRAHATDRSRPRPERRIYEAAVREALVVLWEAADRICVKRLKSLIPLLIPAMERHGHMALDETVRRLLHRVSAASIDRILAPMRAAGSGGRRRRHAHCSAVRRSVPVRTYADWNDPLPATWKPISSHMAARQPAGASCRRSRSPTSRRDGRSARRCSFANDACSAR
jgi:hypothetical protein